MPLSEFQMVALTRRYQTRLAAISAQAGAVVAQVWDELPGYDRSDVPTFTRRTVRPFTAAQAATFATSVGYYSLLAVVRPPAVTVDAITVTPAVRDPFIGYWQALQAGHPWDEAVTIGRSRAEATVTDYVTSTGRQTGDVVAEATGQQIVGWRRVLTGSACEWCQMVSTQRYNSAESADFGHNRCDCTVAPIYGDVDPGRVINRDLLDELKSRPDTGQQQPPATGGQP